jgi:alkylated DNA repair dioxygenase AlkB
MSEHVRQANLFELSGAEPITDHEPAIPGLRYLPEFITQAHHDRLLEEIDRHEWLRDLRRRVQHYGYKYDYKARTVDPSMRLGPLPDWALEIAAMFRGHGLCTELPDQLIINEYERGQGIKPHVDCVPCFGDTILSLSLGSFCLMDFTCIATGEKAPPQPLEPRSLLVLQGDARYQWTHGIAPRLTDRFAGRVVKRDRRVSLTFRKVILSA